MESTPFADIIFFALLAGFIGYKLYNTLGKGTSGPVSRPRQTKKESASEAHVSASSEKVNSLLRPLKESASVKDIHITDPFLARKVEQLKKAYPQFTISDFMEGAKGAFEMVFTAFQAGDKDTLKALLSNDLYEEVVVAIDGRSTSEKREEATLLAIKTLTLKDARVEKNIAKIGLEIISDQMISTKDKNGKVLEGSSVSEEITDYWEFERDITSKDPNWTITNT